MIVGRGDFETSYNDKRTSGPHRPDVLLSLLHIQFAGDDAEGFKLGPDQRQLVIQMSVKPFQASFFIFRFFWAVDSISLIRFSWLTSLAPGS